MTLESHIYFIFVELLKNSMRASLEAKNNLPIEIKMKFEQNIVEIKLSDKGKGMKNPDFMFHYFFSTAPVSTPTYTYSGNFGVPFTGLGCGTHNSYVWKVIE